MLNALFIGVLWGASITSCYPFIAIVLQGETVESWFDGQIQKWAKTEIELKLREIEQIEQTLACWRQEAGLASKLSMAESRQAAAEKTLSYLQWSRPWLCGRAPTTPFATLVVVMALLIAATLLKGVCLIANSLLVLRVADRTIMDMRRQFYRASLEMDQKTLDRCGTLSLMSQIVDNTNLIGEGLRTSNTLS